MSVKKWTQDNVTNIKPPGDGDHWISDPELPGFFVRFQNGGEGTYHIRFSVGGKRRKLPLGKVSKVKLADARNEARKHFGTVADRVDPVVERAKAVTASGVLMPALFEPFEAHLRSKRRSDEYIGRTLDYLKGTDRSPYFGPLHIIPLAQINRATVARELNKIEKHNGPVAMTRARAALSKFVSFCYTQGHEFANPVQGTVKYESEVRDRVLQPKELKVIWQTAGNDDYGQCVKLMMLTAARRTQIGSLKQPEMFLDTSDNPVEDRLIALPGQGKRTSRKGGSKNADTFYLPLPRQALAMLLAREPRDDSDHVFGDGGEGGYSGWSKAKAAHEKRIGSAVREQWGFHDFRTAFQTLGQDMLDIDGGLLDACLNHKSKTKTGARGHYDFAKLLKKRREAHQQWADFIENLVKPELSVVPKSA
jgi:integrase